ncbi:MAG: NAD-dependent malic enzyme [Leptospiraceae bacterium]|nr:MAG: NAD-dependent malic enzyme [Leptospiraceae bacterium]
MVINIMSHYNIENQPLEYQYTFRIKLKNKIGVLAKTTNIIAEFPAEFGAIDTIEVTKEYTIRDITIKTVNEEIAKQIENALLQFKDIEIIYAVDHILLNHLGGKLEIKSKKPIFNREDLSIFYTPGVAKVCNEIYKYPEKVYDFTIKCNSVAVVTDGSAVLGLGNLGPEAALPVMEGKAMLFKTFANIDAFPICLKTQNVEEIIHIVKQIEPVFGGINLEDIAAPRCFEIEERLTKELNIPVFHDDQHGTAIVVTAAIINALKIVQKKYEDVKVILVGVGAAGIACTKMLLQLGIKNIIGFDRNGAVTKDRKDLNQYKRWFAENTNPYNEKGSLEEVIKGSDIFIGLSGPNILSVESIKKMNKDAIIFALSNPDPEIKPELAQPYAKIIATGRSDYPNQINNVLCFPGLFRGLLDSRTKYITDEIKLAASYAIAKTIPEDQLMPDYIIPSVFDPMVAQNVAKAVISTVQKQKSN